MNQALRIFAVVCLFAVAVVLHADVTIGAPNNGNCFPFLCNNSGTNVGVAMDWQEAYSHTAFTGAITITNLEFAYAAQFGGTSVLLDGTYDIYLGYSANPFDSLSADQTANRGAGWGLVDHLVVSGNGCDFNPLCHLNLANSFTYDPANGDLLLEIIASGQDLVANGSGNGYVDADSTGWVIYRNYCIGARDCVNGSVDNIGPLVTTFSTGQTSVPEPGTLAMLGSGILGVAGLLRRRLKL
jgi:hypothetical protein